MKLRLTTEAIHDVETIRNHIARSEASAAEDTVDRIAKAVRYLRKWPRIGHVGIVRGTLEWSPFQMPYVIVYRVESAHVDILRSYRHAQDRSD